MGIVVTVFMFCILLLSVPTSFRTRLSKYQTILASITLLAGLWNAFWHGAQHLGEFWGNAALISGLLMTFTSLLLLKTLPLMKKLNNITPNFIRIAALTALAGCFALYTYTLIMLNI